MFCTENVRWLYELEENYSWESGLNLAKDYAFKDKTGVVRLILEKGGRITVTKGYAWDGCSPKLCFLDLLFGTPDGVVHAGMRKPKTYYASLIHDALYQFVPDGLPLGRYDADKCFLRLMEETKFRLRVLYFWAVCIGGGFAWRAKRYVRKTAGTRIDL
jgi:hypothetical protein